MIDIFFEEWVCEAVFVLIFCDGGISPVPRNVLAKPVSIFQAASEITAALCTAVDEPIGSVVSYTHKSDYHPRVDRILSSFGGVMPFLNQEYERRCNRIRAANKLTNQFVKILGEIDEHDLRRELIEKLQLKLENR